MKNLEGFYLLSWYGSDNELKQEIQTCFNKAMIRKSQLIDSAELKYIDPFSFDFNPLEALRTLVNRHQVTWVKDHDIEALQALERQYKQQVYNLLNPREHIAYVSMHDYHYIVKGDKTIEARFTKNLHKLQNQDLIKTGDVIYWKRSARASEPYQFRIEYRSIVDRVEYYNNLTEDDFMHLRFRYGHYMNMSDDEWQRKEETANHVVLIWFTRPEKISYTVEIPDRTKTSLGWYTIANKGSID